ncbi:MAG: hypothetical protein WAK82_28200 [Streptosporangiaceae bacterium]
MRAVEVLQRLRHVADVDAESEILSALPEGLMPRRCGQTSPDQLIDRITQAYVALLAKPVHGGGNVIIQ